MANSIRYKNLIRLLATLSLDQRNNYADRMEQALDQVPDDEMMILFYGDKYQIADVTRKYKLPVNIIDLMCILIDGERLPTVDVAKEIVGSNQPVPPRKQQH